MNREPSFEELVGAETTGAERERLRRAHELLLQAGPPPELPPELRRAPNFGVVHHLAQRRRLVKRRALVLLAATVSIAAVFFGAGYSVGHHGAKSTAPRPPKVLSLTGTPAAPHAQATLAVWREASGNWPMTLSATGLPKHGYYEVYLVRGGRPWISCGTFHVEGSARGVTVSLSAPTLRKGDSWIVTRIGPGGNEPGTTVLRPSAKI